MFETKIAEFFAQYAYHPFWVYGGIFAFMLASGFGLPLPEEVVLISSGLVGYAALHPEVFPPPSPDSLAVNIYILAIVAFVSVMASDYLIFFLGRYFGPKVFSLKMFRRFSETGALDKVRGWVDRYGYYTVIVFRFTPGIRFPGHLMCGALGLSRFRFLMIDGIAAFLSVPSQVLLVSIYGKEILKNIREFKLVVLAVAAVVVIFIFLKRYRERSLIKDRPQ